MSWWHIFGGVVPEGMFAGTYQTIVLGPMDHAVPVNEEMDGLAWLATMNHEPQQEDMDVLAPWEYVQ